MNWLPALKVALLPAKSIVPVCASMMPLLTKKIDPIDVTPTPPLLRKVPLLLKVGVAPPLLTSVSSLLASHTAWLLMSAPLCMHR